MLTIGSLFSGIGGMELGLERSIPGRVVWQVEIEPWPRAILARHWPEADRSVTDVCAAGSLTLPPVDVICGGFPCQDISPAGKGAGIDGAKSGLWREYARLVRELRPRFVVVENSHLLPVRGLGTVLGDLAGLGYDAEWARIGAGDVGAPHRRWRTWIVAWLADPDEHRRGWQGVPTESRQGVPVAGGSGAGGADADGVRRQGIDGSGVEAGHAGGARGVRVDGPDAVPRSALCGVANGVPGWLDPWAGPVAIDRPGPHRKAALRALGNAVVPAVSFAVGEWLNEIRRRENL